MIQNHDNNELENFATNEEFDENLISKFNIINLFGKETLENVQDKISKATGLAFVTVDYKGEPITKMTSFTHFCKIIRNKNDVLCACKASDAFGSIQAAVTQKSCVYFCPYGLLEIAIPIIVRGHYLGGFIGGQVRCDDAPEGTIRLENIINCSKDYKEDPKMKESLECATLYKYEKFVSVAELISLIINQLGEKEVFRVMQKSSLEKDVEVINNSKSKNKLKFEENSEEQSLKDIFELIRDKNFRKVYYEIPKIADSIYSFVTLNNNNIKEQFLSLGQKLLDSNRLFDEEYLEISNVFPINELFMNNNRYYEFWLYNLVNYIFKENSIKKYSLLENVFEYIDAHIEDEISLNEIISNCSLSQGYLSRIFKRQFNISVMEYIHMMKINRAKNYFCFSDMSITDVAFKLGYNESSYFSKVFKKYENRTVYQYKKTL